MRKQVDKDFNTHLHNTFATIQVNADFTLPEFKDLVFGSRYRSKKKKEAARVFLQSRRKAGEIQSLDMERGHATGGRRTFIVYKKASNASDYKNVPMNLLPDIYCEFLPLWNMLMQEEWVSTRTFFDRLPDPIIVQTNSKEVSNFLWLLADKGYANKKAMTVGINSYQKVHNLDEDTLKRISVKYIKKRVGEKTMTAGQKASLVAKPAKVIKADKMVEVQRPKIDPDHISEREFVDSFINSRLADHEHIKKLQAEVDSYRTTEDRDRRASKGKVDELNKQVCVLKREKGQVDRALESLARLLKNKEATIDNLRKSRDKRRDTILQLREELEAASRKLASYEKQIPIKMSDLISGGEK